MRKMPAIATLGVPVAPVVGAVALVIIAVAGCISGWGTLSFIYPVWTETNALVLSALTWTLPIAAGISAYNVAQIQNDSSVLALGLGARSGAKATAFYALIWIVAVIIAHYLGQLPFIIRTVLDAEGFSFAIFLGTFAVTAVAVAFAVALGVCIGLVMRQQSPVIAVVIALGLQGLLIILVTAMPTWFWMLSPTVDVSFGKIPALTPGGLIARVVIFVLLLVVLIWFSNGLSERPRSVNYGAVGALCLLTVGGIVAGRVVGEPGLGSSHIGESCKQAGNVELCLLMENEPRREMLEKQLIAVQERYGQVDTPVKQVRDDRLGRAKDEKGVLYLSIDRSGNNAEYILYADVLGGVFACGPNSEQGNLTATAQLAYWIRAVDLPEESQATIDYVGDSEENSGIIGDGKSDVSSAKVKPIPGETEEDVIAMQEWIRENEDRIQQCEVSNIPGGI